MAALRFTPPYYAVVFTSEKYEKTLQDYSVMADEVEREYHFEDSNI